MKLILLDYLKRLTEREFVITGYEDKVEGKNLVNEGLPFYCGAVTLAKELNLPSSSELPAERVYLELEDLNAIVADVSLNGIPCGVIALKDWRLDVTEFVRTFFQLSWLVV